jgi:hypothetical protein
MASATNKASAAAEIIGKLEQEMLRRRPFGLNLPDMVPLMLGAVLGVQVFIVMILLAR